MMRESFEDDEVAAILNRDFVPVKVDREERPDVDAVYMRACQAMTGSGGWPLTAFLTADQVPFFVGTYFPRHNVNGRVGLVELLTAVGAAWKTDRASLMTSGQALADYLRSDDAGTRGMTRALPRRAFDQLRAAFDRKWGGFGDAPKFPSPVTLLFLMRYYALEGEPEALHMAQATLARMARGGMFDHLGGGFCRYSTDRKWLIPHFEKMLYDNALLLLAYAQAYRITRRADFREIAGRVADYLLAEMRSPEGAFYAAQDADSEGREGAYYALRPEEARRVLGEELGDRFNRAFGITEEGNFECGSVPSRLDDREPLDEALRGAVGRMADYRRARRPLATDDKLMTEWNALEIGALASASGAFGRPDLLEAAQAARRFLKTRMTRPDGLCAYYRDGRAVGRAHLSDYAAAAWADLELYEATFDPALIEDAAALCGEMLERFYDPARGDFYLGEAGADLSFRTKEHGDNATPSGNSVAADVFLRLHALTGAEKWRALAEKLLSAIAARASEYPAGHCFGLAAALRALYPAVRVACESADPGRIERFARLTGSMYLKNAVPAVDAPPSGVEDETAYHLCREGACAPPIDEAWLPGALAEYACAAYAAEH